MKIKKSIAGSLFSNSAFYIILSMANFGNCLNIKNLEIHAGFYAFVQFRQKIQNKRQKERKISLKRTWLSTIKNSENPLKAIYTPSYTHFPHFSGLFW